MSRNIVIKAPYNKYAQQRLRSACTSTHSDRSSLHVVYIFWNSVFLQGGVGGATKPAQAVPSFRWVHIA